MKVAEVLELFKAKEALLEGHFELSSGHHSGHYLQCALMLQYPDMAELLCKALAEKIGKKKFSVVIGPALGGVIVAHEMARVLGVRAIFAERKSGELEIRRGFSLNKNECVLVVEDVVTTGGSALEVAKLIKSKGIQIGAFAALVDRRSNDQDLDLISLVKVDFPVYSKLECPHCKMGTRIVKPGSRSTRILNNNNE